MIIKPKRIQKRKNMSNLQLMKIYNLEVVAYNIACSNWEAWLREVVSEKKLEKIITDYISSCIAPAYPSVKGLAKVISKNIRGKK